MTFVVKRIVEIKFLQQNTKLSKSSKLGLNKDEPIDNQFTFVVVWERL